MNIDPTQNRAITDSFSAAGARQAQEQKAPEGSARAGEAARLEQSAEAARLKALVNQLSAGDEVRPEQVARGRELAADTQYPRPNDLDQLAQALLSPIEDQQ